MIGLPYILLALGGLTAAIFVSRTGDASVVHDTLTNEIPSAPENDFNLPDVLPEFQHGVYIRDYDDAFEQACLNYRVPFALLKSHAIRESNLKPSAYRAEPASTNRPPSASYGLMQILWWPGSDRFRIYGYSDDVIGDGSMLYDPQVNCNIAAQLIHDNFNSFGNLRDTINAYNTGTTEAKRVAPNHYVDDVLSEYSTLIGGPVS